MKKTTLKLIFYIVVMLSHVCLSFYLTAYPIKDYFALETFVEFAFAWIICYMLLFVFSGIIYGVSRAIYNYIVEP